MDRSCLPLQETMCQLRSQLFHLGLAERNVVLDGDPSAKRLVVAMLLFRHLSKRIVFLFINDLLGRSVIDPL